MPALTGLRGVAALWVVGYHLHLSGDAGALLRQGWMGVDIFFILSGFVLAYVYAEAFPRWRLAGHGRFLRLRIARVFPLHLAVMAVLGGLTLLTGPDAGQSVSDFVIALLLMQNWGLTAPLIWNVPAWSLSAEWAAYLGFPAFIWLTQAPRAPRQAAACALLALGVFAVWAMQRGYGSADINGPDGLVRMACEFAAGALLFRATALAGYRLPGVALPAAAALCALAMLGGRFSFLALPAFGLLVLLASDDATAVARLLGWRPVVVLGEISYSLYLVHWTLLVLFSQFGQVLPGWSVAPVLVQDALQLGVCLAVSAVTYRLIERPARAFGRRLAGPALRACSVPVAKG